MSASHELRQLLSDQAEHARATKSRLNEVRSRTVMLACDIADTEDRLAATFERMAATRPAHAGRLRAMSRRAREEAVRERQWAADHAIEDDDYPP